MAVDVNNRKWTRSLIATHSSLYLTVPSPLVKSYGLAKGTSVEISKIENGFKVLVLNMPKVQETTAEATQAEPTPNQGRRFPYMGGVVVE